MPDQYAGLPLAIAFSAMSNTRLIMPRPVPVFEGSIVRLRPIQANVDAEAYLQYSSDPELHRWTGNSVLPSVEAAREELERLALDPSLSVWLIMDRITGRLAGRFFLCMHQREGQRIVGEGNRIARCFWRKGHNREARRLMFHYAFETLHADLYETEVWEPNVNSVRSIEAHGFHLVGQEERFNPKYGKAFLVRHYAIPAAEWRQRHSDH